MTTLGKVAVAGAVVLAALTVYHNAKGPAVAPLAQVVRPALPTLPHPLSAPLPVPVAEPAPRPVPAPLAPRKRAKPPVVAKHVQVKPPAPVALPPPPPPAPATWSDTLFGHAVDRTDER